MLPRNRNLVHNSSRANPLFRCKRIAVGKSTMAPSNEFHIGTVPRFRVLESNVKARKKLTDEPHRRPVTNPTLIVPCHGSFLLVVDATEKTICQTTGRLAAILGDLIHGFAGHVQVQPALLRIQIDMSNAVAVAGTMVCRVSIQLRAASTIEVTKLTVAQEVPLQRFHSWPMPPRLLPGIQTWSLRLLYSRSARVSRRFKPNVGQRGKAESNKCKGKLLQMPPSENHTTSGRRGSLWPIASPATRFCGMGSSAAMRRRVQSTAYKGTAQNNNGKLRLKRVGTITGKSRASGKRTSPVVSTGS